MGLIQNIRQVLLGEPQRLNKLNENERVELAAKLANRTALAEVIELESVSQTVHDIKNWKEALDAANNLESPSRAEIASIFEDIRLDGLLTSQIQNRANKSLSSRFYLKKAGKRDDDLTAVLKETGYYFEINRLLLEKFLYGHVLISMTFDELGALKITKIPFANVHPKEGYVLAKASENSKAKRQYYRTPQFGYGTNLIELGNEGLGVLNKAVPHVLFKKFAQSCWSELCEIYAIPPRVLKTNTQDPAAMRRSAKMMRDMGAAAWFIIDKQEEFSFANGVTANGDVYNNLIALCNNENSMLISGAIIGQDTVNGNRSKDESAREILGELVDFDKKELELAWNTKVIPALQNLGLLPSGELTLEFEPIEDKELLWAKVVNALNYYDIPAEWINATFGLEVVEKKTVQGKGLSLSEEGDFFA